LTIRDGTIACWDGPQEKGCEDIDLQGAWLLPGAIDGHVHFDDPGFTHREDFASGTRAAAAGGVTTIVDMPCTSLPPVTDGSSYDEKYSVVAPKAWVDFALWGGVRGNDFDRDSVSRRLDELRSRGVRSIKTYLISGMDTFRDVDADQLAIVLEEAGRRGMRVGVHAEDRQDVLQATEREQAQDPAGMPASYARARSAEAEAKGVQTCIELSERTAMPLHVVHLACGRGVDLIRRAKARQVPITAETCPHYLAFTVEDLERLGGLLKTAPVVKSAADRQALWEGLADGTLDMVATDHAPGAYPKEKTTGSIWTDYGGVPGVELLLPYLLSEGVMRGRLSLARAMRLLSSNPAQIHSLAGKGGLQPGNDADVVVFDPRPLWTVRAKDLVTRQPYTPFEGMQWQGRVTTTYVRGRLVYDRARGFADAPRGKRVEPRGSSIEE